MVKHGLGNERLQHECTFGEDEQSCLYWELGIGKTIPKAITIHNLQSVPFKITELIVANEESDIQVDFILDQNNMNLFNIE
jgi:hypothetical protein